MVREQICSVEDSWLHGAEQPEKTSGDLEETKEGSARELMWLSTRSHWGMDRETVSLVSFDAFGEIRNC